MLRRGWRGAARAVLPCNAARVVCRVYKYATGQGGVRFAMPHVLFIGRYGLLSQKWRFHRQESAVSAVGACGLVGADGTGCRARCVAASANACGAVGQGVWLHRPKRMVSSCERYGFVVQNVWFWKAKGMLLERGGRSLAVRRGCCGGLGNGRGRQKKGKLADAEEESPVLGVRRWAEAVVGRWRASAEAMALLFRDWGLLLMGLVLLLYALARLAGRFERIY